MLQSIIGAGGGGEGGGGVGLGGVAQVRLFVVVVSLGSCFVF